MISTSKFAVGRHASRYACPPGHRDAFATIFPTAKKQTQIKTLIARYDEGESPAYFLHVDRPLGQ